ncbi:unnamed protein product [Ranitomeya imitator]|uniref:Uncharacterized protein n=1 Tax=Ranitomeya imitator TaxID=111125 RepID=A0ABN9LJ45_9NEOB|nr:unnamed protein product [Ranitomeya imitator]
MPLSAGDNGGTSMSKDPFQEREAEKYDNPIPSREFILEQTSLNNLLFIVKSKLKLCAVVCEQWKETGN